MEHYTLNLSPYLIEFGHGWGIRYYSLAYLLGFLMVYFGLLQFHRWKWSSLRDEEVADFFVWIMLGTLVGGRLGYCLIYDFPRTWNDPLWVIAFWRDGGLSGMSSHGGVAGVILSVVLYCWRNGKDFREVLDNTAILCTAGLFLGRVANFINGELWGRPSDVPWAIIFPASGTLEPRHPSQLYEGLGEGLVLGAILFILRWRGVKGGRIAAAFLFFYAIIRITLENFREPDAQLGFLAAGLTMGQWLSLLMIVGAMALWILRRKD